MVSIQLFSSARPTLSTLVTSGHTSNTVSNHPCCINSEVPPVSMLSEKSLVLSQTLRPFQFCHSACSQPLHFSWAIPGSLHRKPPSHRKKEGMCHGQGRQDSCLRPSLSQDATYRHCLAIVPYHHMTFCNAVFSSNSKWKSGPDSPCFCTPKLIWRLYHFPCRRFNLAVGQGRV